MSTLTDHQRAALDRYEQLKTQHPQLFQPRHLRPIVTDRALLEVFAAAHEVVLGVAAETGFFLFLNDLVQPAQGEAFTYSRLINKGQLEGGTGVAVLAVIANPELGNPGDIVLVEQERHATGHIETAIPRGFGEPGQDGQTLAFRELREETGYIGSEAEFLGQSVIDSGAGDARVSFYRVYVSSRIESAPELGEAIRSVRLISPKVLWGAICSGEVTDSFTLQALALSRRLPD